MSNLVDCPTCEQQLRVPDQLVGQKVRCPQCKQIFIAAELEPTRLGKNEARERPPVQSRAPVFEPLPVPSRRPRQRDEDDDEDETTSSDSNARRFDLGDCLNQANEHWAESWGSGAGFCLICLMACAIPLVGGLLALPLFAGFTIVSLAQLRRKRWEFNDFFKGFEQFGQLFLFSIVSTILSILLHVVIIGPCLLLVFLAVGLGLGLRSPPVVVLAGLLVLAAFAVVTFITLRCCCFAITLIVDQDMGPIDAIGQSWQLTSEQPYAITIGMLVFGLIACLGAIMCGVGVILTIPYVALAHAAAYEQVTNTRRGRKRRRRVRTDDEEW